MAENLPFLLTQLQNVYSSQEVSWLYAIQKIIRSI